MTKTLQKKPDISPEQSMWIAEFKRVTRGMNEEERGCALRAALKAAKESGRRPPEPFSWFRKIDELLLRGQPWTRAEPGTVRARLDQVRYASKTYSEDRAHRRVYVTIQRLLREIERTRTYALRKDALFGTDDEALVQAHQWLSGFLKMAPSGHTRRQALAPWIRTALATTKDRENLLDDEVPF